MLRSADCISGERVSRGVGFGFKFAGGAGVAVGSRGVTEKSSKMEVESPDHCTRVCD